MKYHILFLMILVMGNTNLLGLETVSPIVIEEVLPNIDRIAVVKPQQVSVVPQDDNKVFVTAVVIPDEYDHLSQKIRENRSEKDINKKNKSFIITYTCNQSELVPSSPYNRPILQVAKEYYVVLRYCKESGGWTPYLSDHWSIYSKEGMDEEVWNFWNAAAKRL